MSFETIGFIVSFVFMGAILLWFIIGSKGKWTIKSLCMAMLVSLSFLNWHSIEGMLGWATDSDLPDKYQILWIIVKEPGEKNKDGSIFVLLKDINAENREFSLFEKKDLKEPRLYNTLYTKERHKQAQGILSKLKKGQKIFASGKKGKGFGKKKGMKGKGKNANPWGNIGHKEDLFYILPPAVPPPKI